MYLTPERHCLALEDSLQNISSIKLVPHWKSWSGHTKWPYKALLLFVHRILWIIKNDCETKENEKSAKYIYIILHILSSPSFGQADFQSSTKNSLQKYILISFDPSLLVTIIFNTDYPWLFFFFSFKFQNGV